MDEDQFQSRLSQIATQWTVIQHAHGGRSDQVRLAQAKLLQRYLQPIYRYLTAALGSADAADEVLQEFAVRFLKGGFRGADPEKGKFRSYLKTALGRLVIDYRRKQFRQQQMSGRSDPPEAAVTDSDPQLFDDSWRTEVLNRCWSALEANQQQKGNVYYSVLRFRAEHPELASHEMAQRLNQQLQPARPLTSDSVRQSLKRAREKFAELLIDEIGASIGSDDLDQIERELIDLELLRYCQPALERRRGE